MPMMLGLRGVQSKALCVANGHCVSTFRDDGKQNQADAHDAWACRGDVTSINQLVLSLLGLEGDNPHDAWAFRADGKQGPADAHDAWAFRDGVISKTPLVLWLLAVECGARMLMVLRLSAEGQAQLMLMMFGLSVATSLAKPDGCLGWGWKVEPGQYSGLLA